MTGGEFKEWRGGKNWSQDDAAHEVGVSKSTIQNWERQPEKNIPKWGALIVYLLGVVERLTGR